MKKKVLNGIFTCAFDAEKVKAMRTYAEQKGVDLEAEIAEVLEKKYVQLVPKSVREYIDLSSQTLGHVETAGPGRKPRRTGTVDTAAPDGSSAEGAAPESGATDAESIPPVMSSGADFGVEIGDLDD